MPSAVCSTRDALLNASDAVFAVCETVDEMPVTVCFNSVMLLTVVSPRVISPVSRWSNSLSCVCCPSTVPLMSVIRPAS